MEPLRQMKTAMARSISHISYITATLPHPIGAAIGMIVAAAAMDKVTGAKCDITQKDAIRSAEYFANGPDHGIFALPDRRYCRHRRRHRPYRYCYGR